MVPDSSRLLQKGKILPPCSCVLVSKACKMLYAPDESALEAWRRGGKKLLSHFNPPRTDKQVEDK